MMLEPCHFILYAHTRYYDSSESVIHVSEEGRNGRFDHYRTQVPTVGPMLLHIQAVKARNKRRDVWFHGIRAVHAIKFDFNDLN
jgi:hypothetical protein